MPITMGGMASGIDTDGIIEKLVKVEAKPITQLEQDKDVSNKKKDALNALKSHLTSLSNSAKELYGFRSAYENKKAMSSNESIVQASADKTAEKGMKEIQVIELASTHRIASDNIEKTEKLPSGKFKIEVNGESDVIKFKGGTLESLRDKIDESASQIVTTSYMKTEGDEYILTLESKIQGKNGEILLSGDKDFLKKIGLVSGEKDEKKEKVTIIFDNKYFTLYTGERKKEEENGKLDISKDGNSVSVTGVLWREYVLPAPIIAEKDTILEVEIDYQKEKIEENEDEAIPYRVEIGPEEGITIKGIQLKGYNVHRIRTQEKEEKKKREAEILGIGVVSTENGKRIEKIYDRDKDVKGKQTLPVGSEFAGKKISKVIFYCNDGIVKYSNANILTPIKGIGALEPKNVIKKANDAKFKVDDIEVVRSKNNGLNDVIKGVTLDLKNKSDQKINIRIEPDISGSIEKIKYFVKLYNEYLDYNKSYTKSSKVTRPGEYNKVKYETGIFVGDMTISKLENSLKTAIGEAYPNRSENPIKILVQTGISTGNINAEWEAIKDGKLTVDESKLFQTIESNPTGIMEFFGSDMDGDNRTDNGLAFKIVEILSPYIQSGNNILVSKINLENEAIKSADERIDRHKEHLKKYEEKLRAKFAAMEKSISQSKSQGNWMKSQMGGDSDDKK